VFQLDSNRFVIRFHMEMTGNFQPGDVIQTTIRAKAACGADLPQISLAYDPSFKFTSKTITGLTTKASDTWGVSWVDVDGNGFEDVFVAEYENGLPSLLYLNNGDETFTEVDNAFPGGTGGTVSSAWADYDNDGDIDVVFANNIGSVNQLYANDGSGSFTLVEGNVSSYAGYAHGASWADYDNDGHLDLFIADFMPTRFNVLYHNKGDGTFEEVTNTPITAEAKYSVSGTWSDIDQDGDVDLLVLNTNGETNDLFINQGAGNFEKRTSGHLVTATAASVGASWGDYDNDGDQDIFIANASNQNNFLYRNNGGIFEYMSASIVGNDRGHSHGSSWADFDNDGDLDLTVTNDQYTINFFYVNDGDGTFTKIDNPVTQVKNNSFGHAWSDYDNDGDLDLFIGNHGSETNEFYENERAQCSSWFCAKLTGVNANKSALGTKISVLATIEGVPTWQTKEITNLSGGGASGQGTLRPIFGLGDAAQVDSVVIQWPSGVIERSGVSAINTCTDRVEQTGVQVCGKVYEDVNANCLYDAGDVVLANQQVVIDPVGIYLSTDENGMYTTYLSEGDYDITLQSNPVWENNCAAAHTFTVTSSGNYCNKDFGIEAICTSPDLEASISTSALRRGLRNIVQVQYANRGSRVATNAVLKVHAPSQVTFLFADSAWSQVDDTTYTWNLGAIEAGFSGAIIIKDSVSRLATLEHLLTISTEITSDESDCGFYPNTASVQSEVVGSVDPNDKLVFPKGLTDVGYVRKTDTLTYTIRFQNIGTYAAERVLVIDTLSQHLDPSTIQLVGNSHPTQFFNENGIIRWLMQGIHLPDSTSNEPESHGYVSFKILPKATTPDNAVILNDASIQFDFNEHIITNTTINTVKYNFKDIAPFSVLALPNPTNATFKMMIVDGERNYPGIAIRKVVVKNYMGTILHQMYAPSQLQEISIESLPAGSYIIEAQDEFGNPYVGKVVKI